MSSPAAKHHSRGRRDGALFRSRPRIHSNDRPPTDTESALITSADNQHLKTIRKLREKRWRARTGMFLAEGEDLVDAARTASFEEEVVLVGGVDVEGDLLASASTLGSGTRVIGVYRQRWSEPGGRLSVYIEGVSDPGNVGAIIRSTHAFADGPVVLGPGCADPFGPKAVRASMGSLFARPPARAGLDRLTGTLVALDRAAGRPLDELELQAPVVLCLGAEREGVSVSVLERASEVAHIPMRAAGPESLNVAMAASVALYAAARRMAADG